MTDIAWRMLVGDTSKYISLVSGLAFAILLIIQQSSIFIGLMARTYGVVTDTPAAKVWVMDPEVEYPEEIKMLKDSDLFRVRDVPGVDWAVPLFRSVGRARTHRGDYQTAVIIGLDDATLIGAPRGLSQDDMSKLRENDAVLIDENGAKRLNVGIGSVLELNDHRAHIVGVCKAQRTFLSFPVLYTTYSRARAFAPQERHMLPFILVSPKEGVSDDELAKRIHDKTGLGAYTAWVFAKRTLHYYTVKTGVSVNFMITVFLGFIVGLAIAAQTFYSFTMENLRHFAALKAMGCTNKKLIKMIIFQALVTGILGYGIGLGGAAIFGRIVQNSQLAFLMPPELLAVSFGLMILLVTGASLLSVRTLMKIEPAIVFRG